MKPSLLFLCHRIPFPPNKGDKIRSFNILKKLAENYDVHLAALVDDKQDWQYKKDLMAYCKTLCLVGLDRKIATIKGLSSFLTGKAITLPYFYNTEIKHFTHQTLENCGSECKIFIFSSSMAQYVDVPEYKNHVRVIDFVDVDSDKWRQYAENKQGIKKWVYQREYKKLAAYEQGICERFNASLFVSPQEAQHFQQLIPSRLKDKVHAMLNGVDCEYFSSSNETIATLPLPEKFLCFTGAMDYWANEDAVIWFTQHVWPQLIKQQPDLHFYIVGGKPSDKIKALIKQGNITVTGRVADVRPYIKQSTICIAPMRIARGIQNKVLEAMAMAKPIVLTSMAAEGIELPQSQQAYIVDDVPATLAAIIDQLNQPTLQQQLGNENQQRVHKQYQWQAVLGELERLLI